MPNVTQLEDFPFFSVRAFRESREHLVVDGKFTGVELVQLTRTSQRLCKCLPARDTTVLITSSAKICVAVGAL